MAKDLKTKLRIDGDTKGADKALKGTQKELGKTGKAAGKTSKKTDKLAKSFGGLGSVLRKVGAGLAVYFSAKTFLGAINGAAQLETQLDRVASVSADYADRIKDVTKASKEMGATTAFTGKQAAEGFEEFARAGIDVDVAIESMADTLALAKAETLGLGQAADIVTGSLKTWSSEGETAATITDRLKATASNSRASVEQLNRALIDAAPLAKSAGLSFSQTTAALGRFADAGFRGERGGTALKNILAQLATSSSAGRKALLELGYAGDDFVEAVDAMAAAGEKGQAAALAFGLEAGPALQALVGQGAGAIQGLTDKIEGMDGAAKQAAESMSDNLEGALIGLSSAWAGLTGALTTPLLEPLKDQVNALSERFRAWIKDGTVAKFGQQLKDGFDAAVIAVREFVGEFKASEALADFRTFITEMKTGLGSLKEKFAELKTSSSAVLDTLSVGFNLLTGTIKVAAAGISGLLTAVSFSLQGFAEIFNAIGVVSDQTLEKFRANTAAMAEVTKKFAEEAGEDYKSVAGTLGLLGDEMEKLPDYSKGIDATLEVTRQGLIKTATEAKEAADKIKGVGDAAKGTTDGLSEAGSKATTYAEVIALAGGKAGKGWTDGTTAIKAAVEKLRFGMSELNVLATKTEKEVTGAFERMGIKTAASMDALADRVEKDYAIIRNSGEATAAGLESAARQYIQAWTDAHGGILPRLQDMTVAHGDLYLAILEVEKAEERKGLAAERASALGVSGTQAEIDKQRELQGEIDKTRAATDAYEAANAKRGGAGTNPSAVQRDRVQSQGDAQALADFDKAVARALDPARTVGQSFERQLDVLNSLADKAIAQSGQRAASGSSTTRSASTAPAAAPTKTIQLMFGNGRSLTATGDTDAFLAQAEQDQSRGTI